jgi:hypothetical protein
VLFFDFHVKQTGRKTAFLPLLSVSLDRDRFSGDKNANFTSSQWLSCEVFIPEVKPEWGVECLHVIIYNHSSKCNIMHGKMMVLIFILILLNIPNAVLAQGSWKYDWAVRTDRYGKPAGIFDETPFPITETTESYAIRSDEFPDGKTYYLGTKYYVDWSTGVDAGNCQTFSSPCRTINYAITSAGNGNNAIIVRGGTYSLSSSLVPGVGTDDTHRLMIVGYGQERPVLDGSILSDSILKGINKPNYHLTLQRLKVQNSPYEGLQFLSDTNTDSDISVVDLWIYNTTSDTPISGDGNLHFHQTNNIYITHTTSEHTYDHCYKIGDNVSNAIVEWSVAKECGYWDGIAEVTTGTACGFDFPSDAPQEPANAILRYSIVSDVLFACAQIRRQNNYSIHHNEFYDCPNLDAVTGERNHLTNTGNVNIHQTSYGNFYDNIVRSGPDGEGVADSACTDCLAIGLGLQSTSVQTSNIYNNVFYDIARPVFVYGYTGDGLIQHYNIYENSIYGKSDNTLAYIPSGSVTTGEDSVSFRNNIVYQDGSSASSRAADFDSDIVRDYNLYYAPSGSVGVALGTGELNVNPRWQIMPSGSYEPGFFDLASGSPAIDSGTDLPALFASSFNGVARPQGSGWDIGVYEYMPACGNGLTEPGEACDGSDLNGYTCATVAAGFVSGTLDCKADCSGYDVSLCVKGNTINAANCSQEAVQAAVNSASNGDTVNVPAGSCVWSSTLMVTKRITLQGAGIDITNITKSPAEGEVINLYQSGSRLTGFTFINGTARVDGDGWRIDHCKFYSNNFMEGVNVRGEREMDHSTGVVDHCEFYNTRVLVVGWAGLLHHWSWAQPLNLGSSDDVVYVEDCIFNATVFANAMDSNYGGMYVFRYNKLYDTTIEAHSLQGNHRATRKWEIYNNTINQVNRIIYTPFRLRGGTGVVFNNILTGIWTDVSIALDNVRSCGSVGTSGQCNGSSSWDGNESGQNGYPCRDQIGRSADAYLWTITNPYPPQALDPAYAWNNLYQGNPLIFNTIQCAQNQAHIQANRDYYNNIQKPDYTPYVYPHPLTLIGAPIPGLHPSDINRNGCVELNEMIAFMDRWKISSSDVAMPELMESIGLWKSGTGC